MVRIKIKDSAGKTMGVVQVSRTSEFVRLDVNDAVTGGVTVMLDTEEAADVCRAIEGTMAEIRDEHS